jgi:REP element-mobilizing transposase RayT
MPQSLASLHIHLVFSTKHRTGWLDDAIRHELHRYMAGVLREMKCPVVEVNSVEDHIHILFQMSRTKSIASIVEEVKTTSSKWIKTKGERFEMFRWQIGYGAFAVSKSRVASVVSYIQRQREHHPRETYDCEYIQLLQSHGIEFDPLHFLD